MLNPSNRRFRGVSVLMAAVCGCFVASGATLSAAASGFLPGPPLTLAQALEMAEQASPALKAAQERVTQAAAEARISAAFYYPHLVAAAATGTGLAGSPGLVPDGMAGVIGSPFVAGPGVGADVSASWDLLDVGAILDQAAAKDVRVSAAEQLRFVRVQVDQAALLQYFAAINAQGEAALWRRESERVRGTYTRVRYYESVGRYSEVQLLLLREMLRAAQLETVRAGQALHFELGNLALSLGEPGADLQVPDPGTLNPEVLDAIRDGKLNPLLAYAQAQVRAARHLEKASWGRDLPRVFANASVGDVDKTLVVRDRDYAASIGVALPLFEGFQNKADLQRAKSAAREQERLFEDTGLKIAYANDRYGNAVALDRMSLDSLKPRRADAQRALEMAQYRYLHLTGPLSDLQEALGNLTEIEAEMNAAQSDLWSNLGAQKLFNGGVPRQGGEALQEGR